jgi:hypothetical protein
MKPVLPTCYIVWMPGSDPRKGAMFADQGLAQSYQRTVLALGRPAELLKLEAVQ